MDLFEVFENPLNPLKSIITQFLEHAHRARPYFQNLVFAEIEDFNIYYPKIIVRMQN